MEIKRQKIKCIIIVIACVFFLSNSIREPKVNNIFVNSVTQNARKINSLDSDNYSDLQFLRSVLLKKRVIFLGESSHYVKEYSQVKIRLIKYLTKELGYRVIAFESPISELLYYSKNSQCSSDSILKNGIYKMWHTKDNLELISYIKRENLKLVGFDIQINSYGIVLKYIRNELGGIIDRKLTENLLKMDSLFILALGNLRTKNNIEKEEQLRDSLIVCYDKVFNEVLSKRNDFEPGSFSNIRQILDIKKSLVLAYGKTYTSSFRDSLMAENLTWIINKCYKNEKIIVWAHNYHIMKNYPLRMQFPNKIMGAELDSAIKKESYSIGLYCYKGEIPSSTKINKVKVPHNNSLEAIIHTSGFKYTFIDFRTMPYVRMNSWIYNPIEAMYSGLYIKDRIIASECYDGIIQIDSVSPSINLNYTK